MQNQPQQPGQQSQAAAAPPQPAVAQPLQQPQQPQPAPVAAPSPAPQAGMQPLAAAQAAAQAAQRQAAVAAAQAALAAAQRASPQPAQQNPAPQQPPAAAPSPLGQQLPPAVLQVLSQLNSLTPEQIAALPVPELPRDEAMLRATAQGNMLITAFRTGKPLDANRQRIIFAEAMAVRAQQQVARPAGTPTPPVQAAPQQQQRPQQPSQQPAQLPPAQPQAVGFQQQGYRASPVPAVHAAPSQQRSTPGLPPPAKLQRLEVPQLQQGAAPPGAAGAYVPMLGTPAAATTQTGPYGLPVSSAQPAGGVAAAAGPISGWRAPQQARPGTLPLASAAAAGQPGSLLAAPVLQALLREVDPKMTLAPGVVSALEAVARDFLGKILELGCAAARRRRSDALAPPDLAVGLERLWNIHVPGFGDAEFVPYRRPAASEVHKARQVAVRRAAVAAAPAAEPGAAHPAAASTPASAS